MRTAVYRFFDSDDVLLYIGVTDDPDERWRGHASSKTWWPNVARKTLEWFESREEGEAEEKRAIRDELPCYNVRGVPGAKPRTIVATSPFWDYVQRVAPGLSTHKIAKAMGGAVGPATIGRWKESTPSGDSIVAFARTFGRSPLEAFAAAGLLTEDEVARNPYRTPVDLTTWTNEQLVAELLRIMNR